MKSAGTSRTTDTFSLGSVAQESGSTGTPSIPCDGSDCLLQVCSAGFFSRWKCVGWRTATAAGPSGECGTRTQASKTMRAARKIGQSSTSVSYSPPSPHGLQPYNLYPLCCAIIKQQHCNATLDCNAMVKAGPGMSQGTGRCLSLGIPVRRHLALPRSIPLLTTLHHYQTVHQG